MQIENFEYLLETARCQSISAAAKKFFISQSTMSSIIQSVEKQLNIKFFQRTSKGVRLTEQGQEAIPIITDMMNQYHKLTSMSQVDSDAVKIVHIATFPCICSRLSAILMPLILDEAYKNVVFSLHATAETKILSRVTDGTVNIAVGFGENDEVKALEADAKRHSYVVEPLYDDYPCCYVNASSPLAGRDPISVKDLGEECLATSHCCVEAHGFGVHAEITKKVVVLSDIEAVLQSVEQRGFVAILPHAPLASDPRVLSGAIKRVPICDIQSHLTSYIVYPRRNHITPLEKVVVSFLKSELTSARALYPSGCQGPV